MGIHIIFFLFLDENICCGYSLEAPRRGASNEYPQHMFLLRNKKDISIFRLKKAPYLLLCLWNIFYTDKGNPLAMVVIVLDEKGGFGKYHIRPDYHNIGLRFIIITGTACGITPILRVYIKKKDQRGTCPMMLMRWIFFSVFFFFFFFFPFLLTFLYKSICCGYSFELHQQVGAIQVRTNNTCLY